MCKAFRPGVAIVVTGTVLVGCATTSGTGGQEGDVTGRVVGTAAGAAIGAIAGGRDRAVQGALIGAAAGFLAGWAFDSYQVNKVKSAQEVDGEYRKSHGGQLPARTVISRYSTATEPAGAIARGNQVRILSDIEVVKGTKSASRTEKVDEELTLYDSKGANPKTVKKTAIEKANESGKYSSQFSFKPSKDAAQGVYAYKTVLYLNDQPVRESQGRIQVVWADPEVTVAAAW